MMDKALTARRRKALGVYYTPRPLVDLLLDHALPPTLEQAGTSPLRICDPACGAGDFLIAVHQRLAEGSGKSRGAPVLFGIDLDRQAVEVCRLAVGGPPEHFVQADALLSPPAFLQDQSFDLVVGNPPFVNPIEGDLSDRFKARLRDRFPRVRGAADLACYFLDLAIRLARPGGRVALVLPRGLLNSPAAAPIRQALPPHLRPNLIWAPERHNFFANATVFVCLLILGPDPTCKISTDDDPQTMLWHTGVMESHNWWREMLRVLGQATPAAPRFAARCLGDAFEIGASLTAGDAYDLVAHLHDSPDGDGPKLITTGLIDRGGCSWGQRRCRYLRRDFQFPRVVAGAGLTPSLCRRLEQSRRPKVLVAGLSRQVEAFLDEPGHCIGAVSTYSICHPADDVGALRRVLEYLLSPDVSRQLVCELAANALRGQHITVKKGFLRGLPWTG